MGTLHELKVPERTNDQKTMEEKIAEVREFAAGHPKFGIFIYAYAKKDDGNMSEYAAYQVQDVLDAYVLPELVKAAVIRTREK